MKNYQAVSYRMDVKDTLGEAISTFKTLSRFKKKANYRDNSSHDIEINKRTPVTKTETAQFEFHPIAKRVAETQTINDINASGYDTRRLFLSQALST